MSEIQFTLELQTPTILLNLKPKDAAGKTDNLAVEFKRYNAAEGSKKLSEYEAIAKKIRTNFDATDDADIESLSFNDTEVFKDFVRAEIKDFKKVKTIIEGKPKVVNSLAEISAESGTSQVSAYFELLWNSAPYRNALLSGVVQALSNLGIS